MTYTVDSLVELPLCEDICRLCLQDDETLWNIFEATDGDGINLKLAEKVIACLDIMVVIGDGLPDLICGKCMSILRSFFEFRKQCKDNDTNLRKCFLAMDKNNVQRGEATICNSPELSPREMSDSGMQCDQSAFLCMERPSSLPLSLRLGEKTIYSPLLKQLEDEWSDDELGGNTCASQEDPVIESPWRLGDLPAEVKNSGATDIPSTSTNSNQSLHPDKSSLPEKCSPDLVMGENEEKNGSEVSKSNNFNSAVSLSKTGDKKLEKLSDFDDNNTKVSNDIAEVTEEMLAGRVSRSKDGKWVCSTCNKNYTTLRALKKHILVHYLNHYKCSECPASFDNEEALSVHKSQHSLSFLFLGHSCKHCFKSFRLQHLLEQHIAAEHTHSSDSAFVPKEFHDKCGKCAKVFYSGIEMETHDESCGNWSICSEEEESADEVSIKPTPAGKKCHLCQLNFETFPQYTYHFKKVHKEEPKFKCDACVKVFDTFLKLSDHRSKVHKEKHFCEYCSKPFREKSKLRRHISSVHMEDRPFKCNLCDKSFKSVEVLRSHTHTHTKPFKCSKCVKNFRSKNQLSLHENAVHLGIRDLMCERCGDTFINNTRLKYHKSKSMSQKLECEVCGKMFCIKNQFQKHLKVHLSNTTKL